MKVRAGWPFSLVYLGDVPILVLTLGYGVDSKQVAIKIYRFGSYQGVGAKAHQTAYKNLMGSFRLLILLICFSEKKLRCLFRASVLRVFWYQF